MFSGIVESVQPVLKTSSGEGVVRVWLQRPPEFNDLKIGDSVAVDGVCLTVEAFTEKEIQFALAAETLKVLKWPEASGLQGRRFNLERSLRYGDRIHGHLVSGHVDSLAQIKDCRSVGESFFIQVSLPQSILPFVWKKGSITLNGVILTVNELENDSIEVCLIPETQKRTNLATFKKGDFLNVEPDWMAKAFVRSKELQK